jgi:type III restriction enzyme
VAAGKKTHANQVPCHTELEKQFADYLDKAPDVVRYVKNERFGFSITYYDNNRPRQYYPDFIITVREPDGRETNWIAEPKGEMRLTTTLKQEAAQLWCRKMSSTEFGPWQYLLVPQRQFERLSTAGIRTFAELAASMSDRHPAAVLKV